MALSEYWPKLGSRDLSRRNLLIWGVTMAVGSATPRFAATNTPTRTKFLVKIYQAIEQLKTALDSLQYVDSAGAALKAGQLPEKLPPSFLGGETILQRLNVVSQRITASAMDEFEFPQSPNSLTIQQLSSMDLSVRRNTLNSLTNYGQSLPPIIDQTIKVENALLDAEGRAQAVYDAARFLADAFAKIASHTPIPEFSNLFGFAWYDLLIFALAKETSRWCR